MYASISNERTFIRELGFFTFLLQEFVSIRIFLFSLSLLLLPLLLNIFTLSFLLL